MKHETKPANPQEEKSTPQPHSIDSIVSETRKSKVWFILPVIQDNTSSATVGEDVVCVCASRAIIQIIWADAAKKAEFILGNINGHCEDLNTRLFKKGELENTNGTMTIRKCLFLLNKNMFKINSKKEI